MKRPSRNRARVQTIPVFGPHICGPQRASRIACTASESPGPDPLPSRSTGPLRASPGLSARARPIRLPGGPIRAPGARARLRASPGLSGPPVSGSPGGPIRVRIRDRFRYSTERTISRAVCYVHVRERAGASLETGVHGTSTIRGSRRVRRARHSSQSDLGRYPAEARRCPRYLDSRTTTRGTSGYVGRGCRRNSNGCCRCATQIGSNRTR